MAEFLQAGVRPVVIIPGILGCWMPTLAPKGKIDPLIHVYDNQLDALRRLGYVDGVSLFTFPYDWRIEVTRSGEQLGNLIASIKKQGQVGALNKAGNMGVPGRGFNPFGKSYAGPKVDYNKVDIIAHSMGGLVARAYIQGPGYAQDVARFFTLSTPHRGAISAYYAVEGGDSTKIGIPLEAGRAMLALLRIREDPNPINKIVGLIKLIQQKFPIDLFQELGHNMPAVRDLLPLDEDNYIYSLENDQQKIYPFGSRPGFPENSTLNRLNSAEALAVFDTLEEVWSLVSGALQTRVKVLVSECSPDHAPMWRYGEPLQNQPPENFAPGDTLVTPISGKLPLERAFPEGTPTKVKHYWLEVDKKVGKQLDHVGIVYEAAAVRFLLGCMLADKAGNPQPPGPEVWDKPSPDVNKPNYLALFR